MQIELCSFYLSREQAVKLHWSLTLIKSSQQRLILIFAENKLMFVGKIANLLAHWMRFFCITLLQVYDRGFLLNFDIINLLVGFSNCISYYHRVAKK